MDEDEQWIQEQKKLLNIKMNYTREPLEYIHFHFCYVDANDSIINIKTEKHIFSDLSNQTLSESDLLAIIEEKKHESNINYVFSELSLFIVDLEPENIKYIETEKTPFFRTLPIISDINIPQSIFIFHPLNSLFFLFKRRKSCIKQYGGQKTTKKVMFSSLPQKYTRRKI